MNASEQLRSALRELPLVAILRGLTPGEAPAIGQALVQAGFVLIEVPLNSPEPLQSVACLARQHPRLLIGAGTVLTPGQVREVHAAGGRLIVSPNFDASVVREALDLGMACVPGVATPSEAYAALQAGAHALKLFPAEMVTPTVLKSLRAVLPPDAPLLPVGGIGVHNMAAYRAAGASGFGIGSALYAPAKAAQDVASSARQFIDAWRSTP